MGQRRLHSSLRPRPTNTCQHVFPSHGAQWPQVSHTPHPLLSDVTESCAGRQEAANGSKPDNLFIVRKGKARVSDPRRSPKSVGGGGGAMFGGERVGPEGGPPPQSCKKHFAIGCCDDSTPASYGNDPCQPLLPHQNEPGRELVTSFA